MKKIVALLTATRAEYGLLRRIISRLQDSGEFEIRLVVTGAHLSPEFGLTYQEVENDGFQIDNKIEILLSADTPSSVSKTMGLALISFADYFKNRTPDLLIVLGDRYETVAVALAAMNQRIPIAHLYGGETTEGAIDESVRHAITKLSHLHFTSTEEYRARVIQLGEHPSRVHNVGAMGVENILEGELLTRDELAAELGILLTSPYAVATLHPVTLESGTAASQTKALLEVCRSYRNLNFVFTKANADSEGRIINQLIEQYAREASNMKVFTSLGTKKYLSLLKYASLVVGNSSSGLVEAPSLGIPTVNIGDRQKGRIIASSVINCDPTTKSIHAAIAKALSDSFAQHTMNTVNPYGKGNTSAKIVEIVRQFLVNERNDLKKKFYDIRVD